MDYGHPQTQPNFLLNRKPLRVQHRLNYIKNTVIHK